MICILKPVALSWVAIVIFASNSATFGAPVWVSVPLNPTYAERGSQVLLNWTVSYDASSPSWRKWYEATESGTQIGKPIMTKYQSNAVKINRPEYEGRLEFVYNGAILLKNVSLSDEGFIRFGVDFTDGEHLQHQIMLNVTIPPSVVFALPNETIALESRSFSTQCIFESRPAPYITWYINGDLLVNGSRFRIDSQFIGIQNNLTSVRSILTINKVIVNDTGRIMCLAEIPFGTLSSNGTLAVHYAPKVLAFTSNKVNGIAIVGEAVQFTCSATSLPSASYEIRHNNVLIRNSTNQVYKIANVSLADEGKYTCMAYNYIGYSATSSNNLIVYDTLRSSSSTVSNSQTANINNHTTTRSMQPTTCVVACVCNKPSSDEWNTRDSAFVAAIAMLVIIVITMSIVIIMQMRKPIADNQLKDSRKRDQGNTEMRYMDLETRSREGESTYAQLQGEYEEVGQQNPQYVNT